MDITMHAINVARHICTEEVFKGIQNLNVVLVQNLHVVFVAEDSLKGLTCAGM